MKFLSPKIHGIIDYLTSATFMAVPLLFMLEGVPAAVMGCYVIGGALLLVSLITRYPLGALRIVPFPVHGAIELIVAPLIVAYPWLAGFSDVPPARNFYIVAGAALFLVWLVTDYKAAEAPQQSTAAATGMPAETRR